ncbi:hypothetical protein LIER_06922 [Lithospermum erythrorhizon]|uniref:IMS import disulfide relay-system CHCH-CHCH-like Cx9C domain-containing protein n=1 Tax=Lithospermum erythrorhizon TaxID=34254 RepID=A0AAV3P6L2_LITER
MKEKVNTASSTSNILRKVLLNCSIQAKAYGNCVAAKIPEVERDMCVKEFSVLRNCLHKVILTEINCI